MQREIISAMIYKNWLEYIVFCCIQINMYVCDIYIVYFFNKKNKLINQHRLHIFILEVFWPIVAHLSINRRKLTVNLSNKL